MAESSPDVLLAVGWYRLKGYHNHPKSMREIRSLLEYRRRGLMEGDNRERISRSDCEVAAKLLFETCGVNHDH